MMTFVNSSLLAVMLGSLLPMLVSTQSFDQFAYPGYVEPVYFNDYLELLGEDRLKKCLRREFPPTSGESCREDFKLCLWGEQRCTNGTVEPTSRCNCKDNAWNCQAFMCPTLDDGTCPEVLTKVEVCRADMKCAYDEQECQRCGVTLPTVQCSCEAGQVLTCNSYDACADMDLTCEDLTLMSQDDLWFPEPEVITVKIDAPKEVDLPENPSACPIIEPEPDMNGEISDQMCEGNDYECDYGWSCCCPDASQCSSDLKCICTDGTLSCKPKRCDEFLCVGPPQILSSPFAEDPKSVNPLCPSYEDAKVVAQSEGQDVGECSTDSDFYHCVYGYECCCPGRLCSSEMQCTCSQGIFTCDARTCPDCETIVEDEVVCPEELPTEGTACPNSDGETCEYGELVCCEEEASKYSENYCTCEKGRWNCFDASFLCELESCVMQRRGR